ncbi:hypothetical protein BJX99DRAFT_178250 [Aspergillus californicus]
MSQSRPVVNELWNFLCPSFRPNTLRCWKATLSAASRRPRRVPGASPTCLQQRRNFNTAQVGEEHGYTDGGHSRRNGKRRILTHDIRIGAKLPNSKPELPRSNRRPTPDVPAPLKSQSTQELEAKLGQIASDQENSKILAALQILRALIRDRGIQPEARHYKWLFQCFSNAERGSPILIRRLLSEMEENGILADSATLHAVLQAIAVHPDYMLRQDVLRVLRDLWLPLSPDGWHYVVAGLIREHQFELALDHMAHMERKYIQIRDWLHSLLIYYLCEFHEYDQIIELMQSRVNQGYKMTQELWMHVLEAASTSQHLDATRFIWQSEVELGSLHPERRLCTLVLETAAHRGDAKLATSVMRFLSQNDMPPQPNDYEVLSRAYARSGDLYTAFRVLCELRKLGHALSPSATEGILRRCFNLKTHSREVRFILEKLASENYAIPLACARVFFDLCAKAASRHDPFEVDAGIAFYRRLHCLCPDPLDATTFNSLVHMCRVAKNTEAAMFIAKEMAAANVLPDATTFEHLILMCLECDNFDSSYRYFVDMQERGFHLSEEARVAICQRCADSSDQSAVKLRSHPEIEL